jgi:hypothetical protein
VLSIEYREVDIEFFKFLRESIPEDDLLLIPTEEMGSMGRYRFRYLIEYHLFPRTIIPCQDPLNPGCWGDWESSLIYVIKLNGYPSEEWARLKTTYVLKPFTEQLGVYIPEVIDESSE